MVKQTLITTPVGKKSLMCSVPHGGRKEVTHANCKKPQCSPVAGSTLGWFRRRTQKYREDFVKGLGEVWEGVGRDPSSDGEATWLFGDLYTAEAEINETPWEPFCTWVC